MAPPAIVSGSTFGALVKSPPSMRSVGLRASQPRTTSACSTCSSSAARRRFASRAASRRPPRDRVNALLSFGYALLMQDCAAAVCGVGLDPAVGYLHEDRPGRLGLALDLMEEMRIPVVDRLVLALINRSQVADDDFTQDPSGGWRLTDEARKRFLVSYQEAKQGAVRHEFLDQDTTWGQVAHLQARLLARTLRGDLAVYPPFTIR